MILKSIKSISVLIICLTSLSIFSQLQSKVSQNGAHTELYFTNPVNTTSTYSKIKGSPYLNEKFLPARVNESNMTYLVRFNVVKNNIEFIGKNDVIMLLPKSDAYEIQLLDGSNKEYKTYSYNNEDNGVTTTFFEKIYVHHDFVIYLKENIYFTPVRLAKHSFEAHRPGKFTKAEETFYATGVINQSEELTELPKKEKQFILLFGEDAARIKQFIKKEKLDIDTKEDLIRIMKFYHNQQ